jgi:glutathione S-transferase
MILVGQYDSPFVRRVAITLHHYGMPFTRNPISAFTDAKEMGRINPLVRIPSLILDSGETLVDSGAIIDHLDELAVEEALTPRTGPERRQVLQVAAVACGVIEKAGLGIVYERHFHRPETVSQEWIARCKTQVAGALSWLERKLDGDWFFGRMTQADVTAATMIGYLHLRLDEVLTPPFPKLEALAARCEALPAFIAARPSANEVMPG